MNKQQKLISFASAAGAIATFLPWISVSAGAFGYSVSESRNGFHGAGVLFFLIMLAIAVMAFAGNQFTANPKNTRLIITGLGLAGLIVLLIAYSNLQEQTNGGFGMVKSSIGIGLILSVLASVSVLLIPFIIKQPGESLKEDFASFKTSVQSMQGNLANTTKPVKSNESTRMAELEKLIVWRNEGKISQQEFEDLKTKII